MPKVTLHDDGQTPHAEGQTAAAPQTAKVTVNGNTADFVDYQGRKVRLRKLDPRHNMRLARLVGADCVKNEEYMIYSRAAYAVAAVDANLFGEPQSIAELEAMADRIGDSGFIGIIQAYNEAWPAAEPDMDAIKN